MSSLKDKAQSTQEELRNMLQSFRREQLEQVLRDSSMFSIGLSQAELLFRAVKLATSNTPESYRIRNRIRDMYDSVKRARGLVLASQSNSGGSTMASTTRNAYGSFNTAASTIYQTSALLRAAANHVAAGGSIPGASSAANRFGTGQYGFSGGAPAMSTTQFPSFSTSYGNSFYGFTTGSSGSGLARPSSNTLPRMQSAPGVRATAPGTRPQVGSQQQRHLQPPPLLHPRPHLPSGSSGPPSLQQQVGPLPGNPDQLYERLPFYDVMDELLKPSTLIPRVTARYQETNFTFSLKPNHVTDISYDPDGATLPRMEIQLRFVLLNTKEKQQDDFPPSITVKLNDKIVQLPPPIPTNKPNAEPKRPSRPVDITPYCLRAATRPQRMGVTWGQPDQTKHWVISVAVVRKVNAQILLQRLKARGICPEAHTRAIIQEKLNASDSEISATNLKVSLLCPLGKMRIQLPSKTKSCSHIQCFDASLFLMMNERRPTWKCPVCDRKAHFDQLIIDGYMRNVLLTSEPDVVDIEVHKDGTWSTLTVDEETNEYQFRGEDGAPPSSRESSAPPQEVVSLDDSIVSNEGPAIPGLSCGSNSSKPNTPGAISSSTNSPAVVSSTVRSSAEPSPAPVPTPKTPQNAEVIDLVSDDDEEVDHITSTAALVNQMLNSSGSGLVPAKALNQEVRPPGPALGVATSSRRTTAPSPASNEQIANFIANRILNTPGSDLVPKKSRDQETRSTGPAMAVATPPKKPTGPIPSSNEQIANFLHFATQPRRAEDGPGTSTGESRKRRAPISVPPTLQTEFSPANHLNQGPSQSDSPPELTSPTMPWSSPQKRPTLRPQAPIIRHRHVPGPPPLRYGPSTPRVIPSGGEEAVDASSQLIRAQLEGIPPERLGSRSSNGPGRASDNYGDSPPFSSNGERGDGEGSNSFISSMFSNDEEYITSDLETRAQTELQQFLNACLNDGPPPN